MHHVCGRIRALDASVAAAIEKDDLSVAAVLSGNRNFEGRIHPQCRLAYLASPALVVAYALAGTMNVDLSSDSIAHVATDERVLLEELWPAEADIRREIDSAVAPRLFAVRAGEIFEGDERWRSLGGEPSALPAWDPVSTYITVPPFCESVEPEPKEPADIRGARCLLTLGDVITTDHISPAVQSLRTARPGATSGARAWRPRTSASSGHGAVTTR